MSGPRINNPSATPKSLVDMQPIVAPKMKHSPSFKQAIAGDYIHAGQAGESVRDLQMALGLPPEQCDGKFGPKTEAALRSYQMANNLRVDGVVGPETLGALHGVSYDTNASPNNGLARQAMGPGERYLPPTAGQFRADTLARADARRMRQSQTQDLGGKFAPGRAPNRFPADQAGREVFAAELLTSNGVNLKEGEIYSVLVDQDQPPESLGKAKTKQYLKQKHGEVAVYKMQDGKLREMAAPTAASSNPAQLTTEDRQTDSDGDRVGDVAHLVSGAYEYKSSKNGRGRFNPTDHRSMKVARDTNHDGHISEAEFNASAEKDDYATFLQIHAGSKSSGCITVGGYQQFSNAVQNTDKDHFTMLVVRRENETYPGGMQF